MLLVAVLWHVLFRNVTFSGAQMRFLWILWSYRESGKPIQLPLWSPNRNSQYDPAHIFFLTKISPKKHPARLQMTPLSWATWAISRLCSWLCGAYSRKNHPQWRCLKMFEWEDNPQMEFVGHFQFLVVRFFAVLGCGRSIMCQHNDISHSDIHPNWGCLAINFLHYYILSMLLIHHIGIFLFVIL